MAMQRKEKIRELQQEQQAQQEEERQDLKWHWSPSVCSCYQVGGRDGASPEHLKKFPWR
jgi:hypothetical protein